MIKLRIFSGAMPTSCEDRDPPGLLLEEDKSDPKATFTVPTGASFFRLYGSVEVGAPLSCICQAQLLDAEPGQELLFANLLMNIRESLL